MAFFNSAVTVLQTLVIALGAGLGIWDEAADGGRRSRPDRYDTGTASLRIIWLRHGR